MLHPTAQSVVCEKKAAYAQASSSPGSHGVDFVVGRSREGGRTEGHSRSPSLCSTSSSQLEWWTQKQRSGVSRIDRLVPRNNGELLSRRTVKSERESFVRHDPIPMIQ